MAKCNICYKRYSTQSSLNRHQQEKHGPKKICPYCFKFYGRLQPHFLVCKIYKRYQINKLKIVGGEIFFVTKLSKKTNYHKNINTDQKNNNLKYAKRINKSSFYFYPQLKIGEGSFCKVFYGFDKKNNNACAVKFFKDNEKNFDKFIMEKSMLNILKNSVSFPTLLYSSSKNLILAETLHGPNLRDLFLYCGKKFPIRTVCFIGIEMISRIEEFHANGFVHRDIKPSNFAWGKFCENYNVLKEHILLIDFDLSGKYRNEGDEHIPLQFEESTVGNLTFKSINGQNFTSETRRDDIESILYCLIYVLQGDLPWNNENLKNSYKRLNRKILRKNKKNDNEKDRLITKEEIMIEFKKRIPVKVLCTDLPTEFEILILYARNLNFNETPDYSLMKDLLKRIIINNNSKCEEDEYKYIWEKKFVDILSKNNDIKKMELENVKKLLFNGYNLDIEKFIKGLKKMDYLSSQSF